MKQKNHPTAPKTPLPPQETLGYIPRPENGETVSLALKYPPGRMKAGFCQKYGLNSLYSGKPWQQRRREAKEIHAWVRSALSQAGIPKDPADFPVSVEFLWDDGLDVDNHAYLGKLILDGLKGWVVADDSRRWVRRVSHGFHDGGCILVRAEPFPGGGEAGFSTNPPRSAGKTPAK